MTPDQTIGDTPYTLDDLAAYLDAGRTPVDPLIEASPECQAMLDSLERVGALSRDLVARDADDQGPVDPGWLRQLLDTIGREVRSGRDVELASPDPRVRLSITEGAIRELVRGAGDSVDGVLVGTCGLAGDLETPGAQIAVSLTISVAIGRSIPLLVAEVRERVYSELLRHTELAIDSIDVTVADVHVALEREPDGGANS